MYFWTLLQFQSLGISGLAPVTIGLFLDLLQLCLAVDGCSDLCSGGLDVWQLLRWVLAAPLHFRAPIFGARSRLDSHMAHFSFVLPCCLVKATR